ncbi:hypothetical protein [Caballeronia sp. LZ035]|uniref:hypothetical protein n=1 Tax=Caballeronia sp. LZ035 TaxID=3038568 RepID=UPI002855E148|nr:hypothetical protein [Caballeronia sp. LZ035]MDR5763295.1 hypothetical protein [Caballeronia sp. LZ035]
MKMHFEETRRTLASVAENIQVANVRIRQQAERINQMRQEGFDIALVLRVMRDSHDASVEHRRLLLERIALSARG